MTVNDMVLSIARSLTDGAEALLADSTLYRGRRQAWRVSKAEAMLTRAVVLTEAAVRPPRVLPGNGDRDWTITVDANGVYLIDHRVTRHPDFHPVAVGSM